MHKFKAKYIFIQNKAYLPYVSTDKKPSSVEIDYRC